MRTLRGERAMSERWVSTREFAEMFELPIESVTRLCREGRIDAVRLGVWRVRLVDGKPVTKEGNQ